MRKRLKWLWLLLLLPALALVAFFVWAEATPPPMPEALAALDSDAQVQVTTNHWLVFSPVSQDPSAGLILYPGGRVDPRSSPGLAER